MSQAPTFFLASLLFFGSVLSAELSRADDGYDAGYKWAEENDIDDTYDCDTPSSSFNEGCEDYVEKNTTTDEDEDEDEDDD